MLQLVKKIDFDVAEQLPLKQGLKSAIEKY